MKVEELEPDLKAIDPENKSEENNDPYSEPCTKIGITRKSHEQSKKKRLMAKKSRRINRSK